MPPHTEQTPSQMSAQADAPGARAQARRYVLSAAAAVLAENPAASMQEIATASGIGRATVYRWFANRDQLIEAIHAQVLAEAGELMSRRLAEDGGALETLVRLSGDIVDLGDRYRFLAAFRDKRPEDRSTEAELTRRLERFIAAGQRAGELRADLTAEWIASAYGGLIVAAVDHLNERRLERAAMAEQLGRTVAAAFGA
jgi:TetR/AcrR family transcriptional repressor of mexCD-oprJ operon